jgi:2-oxoglutarate ferredoxin oxidoreductase subunit gamma
VSQRYEIRLAGSGGQGLLLAGLILAEAAAIYDNKNAVQSQSYGPEARGGMSRSELIISDSEIDYPKVVEPNVVLAMTQESADKYVGDIHKDAVVVIDSSLVERKPTVANLYCAPITDIAKEVTDTPLTASVVALGVIAGLTGLVSHRAMLAAVQARAPRGTAEKNKAALEAGFALAEELKSQRERPGQE